MRCGDRQWAFRVGALGLAGIICDATLVRGTDEKHSVAPPRERLVSPHVAELLAASLPKLESVKLKPAADAAEKPKIETPKDEAAGKEIVVMTPFRVDESPISRHVLGLMEKQPGAPTTAPFTFKDGGTLWEKGPYELKFKYNAQHKGFDIFNLKF